jgi:hypothetical protein
VGFAPRVAAQSQTDSDFESIIEQFNSETVIGYLQPLADLFGANMNSGFFRSAAVPESGFHLSIEFIGMGSPVSDADKVYTAPTPDGFTPGSFETATILGGRGTTVVSTLDPALQYRGSDGILDMGLFPAAAPQIRIGAVAGTELVGRFVTTPGIDEEEFPTSTLWAIGGRHSISQYISESPIDLAIGVFYTSFTVSDIVDFSGVTAGVQAGKEFTGVGLYGGVAWENSTLNLQYTSTDPTADPTVKIDLEGANSFRFTGGLALNLGFFHLFGEGNLGSVTTFATGVAFGN